MIELEKTIIELISKFGELTAYKTVIGAQAPKMTVRYMLKRLVVEGKLECEQRGRAKYYSLPNKQYVTGGEGFSRERGGFVGHWEVVPNDLSHYCQRRIYRERWAGQG